MTREPRCVDAEDRRVLANVCGMLRDGLELAVILDYLDLERELIEQRRAALEACRAPYTVH